ncbi:MAG: penicillin-binding protein 2 [Rhizobiaceae bacterium]|jgi:cell division protein FtsI (penicillin-binding protein 3)|nr:penicillin-binding protein 2 [Rhizobiaceae bacterium]
MTERHSDTDASRLSFEGSGKTADNQSRSRIVLTMVMVGLAYVVIFGRLAFLGFQEEREYAYYDTRDISTSAARPDIRDRNGEMLATDIVMSSLFAEPRLIVDVDEAVEKLLTVLPELDARTVHRRLSSNAGFVWLKRELTPATESRILALGIPGLGFRTETRRFYPSGQTASHLIGYVNIDNVGIAGLEKYIDDRGLRQLQKLGFASDKDLEPIHLAVDLRVQHYVRDELAKAMKRYDAIAAGAVVLNARTGEVVAMASLPDYDPNRPVEAQKDDRINRVSKGLFEMGSTFKTFTTAMALDSGLVTMSSQFDATKPLRIGGHTINDFHAKRRVLNVPEVFIYSSNIGTAKMADVVGIEGHRDFLHKIGLLSRMPFELPEVSSPVEPREWRKINSVTISYGHGAQTTPLQTAVAGAALVNGGRLIPPTLFPRSQAQADAEARQVISPATSEKMRYLMRLNVEEGSGKRAEVPGFKVGGKTGTAEKVVNGRYSKNKRFNAFLAAFPIDDPQYVVLTFIDEPKPEDGKPSATAGLNAAPMVRNIIRRSASVLGVKPDFGKLEAPLLISN